MNNELYHHGVKGMKWGVRKDRRSSSSTKARRSLKNANAQQNKINRAKYPTHKQLMKSTNAKQIYRNRNRLSNKELDNRINRMEKEQHLKDLSRKQESEGKKWVKKILVGAGTAVASKYAVKYGMKMAEYILKHDDSYSNELYHHGVKGMKWGVRKQKYYEKKADKYQRKADKGGLFRRYNENAAATYRVKARNQAAANKETSIKRKLQQKYGLESKTRLLEERSKVFEKRSKRAKTRIGRNYNNAGAYNSAEVAKYGKNLAKKSNSTIIRSLGTSLPAMASIPVKTTFRNKKTTYGAQVLKTYIASVAAGKLASEASSRLIEEEFRKRGW